MSRCGEDYTSHKYPEIGAAMVSTPCRSTNLTCQLVAIKCRVCVEPATYFLRTGRGTDRPRRQPGDETNYMPSRIPSRRPKSPIATQSSPYASACLQKTASSSVRTDWDCCWQQINVSALRTFNLSAFADSIPVIAEAAPQGAQRPRGGFGDHRNRAHPRPPPIANRIPARHPPRTLAAASAHATRTGARPCAA